ncbi:hypothetical protein D3C78_1587710 [compost metagenome]
MARKSTLVGKAAMADMDSVVPPSSYLTLGAPFRLAPRPYLAIFFLAAAEMPLCSS